MDEDPKAFLRRLMALPEEERRPALFAAGETFTRAIDQHWPAWAHKGQLPPHDDWDIWTMLTGRGFGKTRAGAEWVSARARENPYARIALVAATPEEARRVMIEGPAGLLAVSREGEERRHMRWEPTLGRLTFASGAQAFVYSGADGESLRGGEHHFAWCDELAKWKRGQAAWDNLMLTMRAGPRPQVVVTTTPKPLPLLRAVLAMPNIVLTGGASRDNPHLSDGFVRMIEQVHAGTRWERQELLGELIEDIEGALFPRELIAARRSDPLARNALARVVVGVDPPTSAAGTCGIVVCGLGADGIGPSASLGTGYVLDDRSQSGLSPEQWARRVAAAAEAWGAERVVAEGNQGGEMVRSVLKGAGLKLPVKIVHARVGKAARAEPIAACFESGEARFAGVFPALEGELAGLASGGGRQAGASPDRADAMVWALTHLLLAPRAEPRVVML